MIDLFAPHPLVRGGHLQTLIPYFFPGHCPRGDAEDHVVPLPDGDGILLHEERPDNWRPGGPVAILLHGLAGCADSVYMRRIAHKLKPLGVKVFRMNLRGAGESRRHATLPYHAGRSADLAAVAEFVAARCPGSPVRLVGFSLGGAIVMRLAGEWSDRPPSYITGVLAVCPPINLPVCVRELGRGVNRWYDRFFSRLLWRHMRQWWNEKPDARRVALAKPPKGIRDFDERVTAPLGGFASADDYYARSTPELFFADIRLPTLILVGANDPLAPAEFARQLPHNPAVRVLYAAGGHLGFYSARAHAGDRRWLDRLVVGWIVGATP